MRVVFMGTPQIAADILGYLADQHDVVAAFTRPDAIRGRGKKLVQSAVKEKALELGIPVVEAASFADDSVFDQLVEYAPDVICVVAYGALLPKRVLDLPKFGCINVHASLLPRWRGAAPIARAILAGDEETGVSIMRMEEGLDTGDWCVQRAIPIDDRDADELTDELADLGATALLAALGHIEQGEASWVAQDESQVIYAHKIEKGELNIAPGSDVVTALRRSRAADDSHPCKAQIAGKTVTIGVMARPDHDTLEAVERLEPGQVAFVRKRLLLGFSDGVLEVRSLRPDGKKDMDAVSFAAGIQGIKQAGAAWKELS